jgi:hypothetical protein
MVSPGLLWLDILIIYYRGIGRDLKEGVNFLLQLFESEVYLTLG